MQRLLYLVLFTFCIAVSHAKKDDTVRIAIINFSDQTGTKNYGWLGTSVADAINRSMKTKFAFKRSSAKKTQQIAGKILKGKQEATPADLDAIKKKTKSDYLIYGSYSFSKKANKVTVRSWVYNLTTHEKISSATARSPTDSRLFAIMDDIAARIVRDILVYARAQAKKDARGKKLQIKSLEDFIIKAAPESKKMYTLKQGEGVKFDQSSISFKRGKKAQTHIEVHNVNKGLKIFYRIGKKKMGPFEQVTETVYSKDRKKWAMAGWRKGKSYVYTSPKKKKGPYEHTFYMRMSPNGKKLSYRYYKKVKGEQRNYVVVGRKKYGPFMSAFGNDNHRRVHFIDNGKSWVAIVRNPKRNWLILHNGKKIGPFQNLVKFKINESRTTWAAVGKNGNKYSLIVKGKKFGPFGAVESLQLASKGNVFIARIQKAGANRCLVNGKESKILPGRLVSCYISPDGQGWLAYFVDQQKHFIFSNNKRYGPYASNLFIKYATLANSWNARYGVKNYHIVRDGVHQREVKGGWVEFDPSGRYWAAIEKIKVENAKKQKIEQSFFLLGNRRRLGPYDKIEWPYGISSTGAVMFAATTGGKRYLVDERNRREGPYLQIKDFKFADGKRFARVSMRDGIYQSVDGKLFGPYSQFGSDIKDTPPGIWGYRALKHGRWVYVINGREYPWKVFGLTMRKAGKAFEIYWMALRGRDIFLEKIKVPGHLFAAGA